MNLLFAASPMILIQFFNYQTEQNVIFFILTIVSSIAIYTMWSDATPLSKKVKLNLATANGKNLSTNNPTVNWLNIKTTDALS